MATIEVSNPAASGGVAQKRRKQITNAQLLAIRETPIELVPTPGAGYAVDVRSVYMVFDVTTTAYTVGTNDLAVEYTGGTDIQTVETVGFLDQTTDEPRAQRTAISLIELVPNEAVQLKNSGAGEFTGGNAANTLSVEVEYVVVPTTAFS